MANTIPNLSMGPKKNVTSYTVASLMASGLTAAALNYNSYKKGELNKKGAFNNTLKLSVQGGIATGSAVAAGNYIADKKYLNVLTALSIGLTGIYAVEKIAEKFQENEQIEESNNTDESEGE